MKKHLKGPTWKKGQVLLPDVYYPPQELADPEGHLTEEQKKWPRSDLVISTPGDQPPPEVQDCGPNPHGAAPPPAA